MASVVFGLTEPLHWTRPLRELTPETSRGFEVIEFAREILGVTLRPWQEWLLIHALEILLDGSYRFRRVTVLVARQNGKTMLMSVLAAWWIFVDAERRPDLVPPFKFKVVGVAQTLDIAAEVWKQVKLWSDPEPETDEEADLAIPALQAATAKVRSANGDPGIFARNRAHYEMRAVKNTRGKPAARVIMDEGREQTTWIGWKAVSQTTKSFWSNQLWLISNAGDASSVVLSTQRDAGLALVRSWLEYVEAGLQSAEEWANGNDTSIGHFEWSAPEGCAKTDVDGIRQANPSLGYAHGLTLESILSDAATMPDADYRTEVLCQWVATRVDPYISPGEWLALADEPIVEGGAVVHAGSEIAEGEPMVLGVDTSIDRKRTFIAIAGLRVDGDAHVELIDRLVRLTQVPDRVAAIAERWGITHVAVQSRGCPAAELAPKFEELGLQVIRIEGPALGAFTGRMRDRVEQATVRHRGQRPLQLAVESSAVKLLGEVRVWDRSAALPVDLAPLVAGAAALYGLDELPADHDSVYASQGLDFA